MATNDDLGTSRVDPSGLLPEREMLRSWLDFQRATFLAKLEGLSVEQLCEKVIPPSDLSLLGLLRHHTEGELVMFRGCILDEEIAPMFPELQSEFDVSAEIDVDAAIRAWRDACKDSRTVEASVESLDARCKSIWGDEEGASLRWIMMHAIEEYARHNGHADLLRERLDGATGY